jgi:hypothetical protein
LRERGHTLLGELDQEGEESLFSRKRLSSWRSESNNKRRAHSPRERGRFTTTARGVLKGTDFQGELDQSLFSR